MRTCQQYVARSWLLAALALTIAVAGACSSEGGDEGTSGETLVLCGDLDGQPTIDVANSFDAGDPCGVDRGLEQLQSVRPGVADEACEDGTFIYWNDQGYGHSEGTWSASTAGLPPQDEIDRCRSEQIPSSTTTTAVRYPRAPTSAELAAVIAHYEARNAAAFSASTLRAFWLDTAHPALGCTADHMGEILLPGADSPLWLSPVTMVPDLESLLITEDEDYGAVATVQRTNVEVAEGEQIERSPQTDQLILLDDMAYQWFDCPEPVPVDELLAGADPRTIELFERLHTTDLEGAISTTLNELTAQDSTPEDFVAALRWDWGESLAEYTDGELIAQAEAACQQLAQLGAQGVFDRWHAPRAASSLEDLPEDHALWGQSMFYQAGLLTCRDEAEDAWVDWVRLDLEAGLGQGLFVEEATTLSEEQWVERILIHIEGVIDRPSPSPYQWGQLHASAHARAVNAS